MGATVDLPLLDAMLPAATKLSAVPALNAKRISYPFISTGADMSRWTPPSRTLDELSYILGPLAPVKDNVTVWSNPEFGSAFSGSHATSTSAFLSATRGQRPANADYGWGTTVD